MTKFTKGNGISFVPILYAGSKAQDAKALASGDVQVGSFDLLLVDEDLSARCEMFPKSGRSL